MSMTQTTNPTQATQITMRNGFDRATIAIDHRIVDLPSFVLDADGKPVGVEMIPSDSWLVTVIGYYDTAQGARVGAVKEHSFGDHVEARAYANGWFASLKSKGYARSA